LGVGSWGLGAGARPPTPNPPNPNPQSPIPKYYQIYKLFIILDIFKYGISLDDFVS